MEKLGYLLKVFEESEKVFWRLVYNKVRILFWYKIVIVDYGRRGYFLSYLISDYYSNEVEISLVLIFRFNDFFVIDF